MDLVSQDLTTTWEVCSLRDRLLFLLKIVGLMLLSGMPKEDSKLCFDSKYAWVNFPTTLCFCGLEMACRALMWETCSSKRFLLGEGLQADVSGWLRISCSVRRARQEDRKHEGRSLSLNSSKPR